METGAFGFPIVPASVEVAEDQISVLRLLGRLEVALTPQIRGLIYPDIPERTMYRRLAELQKQGLIWRQAVSLMPRRRDTTIPPERTTAEGRARRTATKQPYVWGLTPEGKTYLETNEAEPDAASLAGLKTRDRRSPNVPLGTLVHDLQASWWCSGIVAAASQHRCVTGIFVQVEFVTDKSQRLDALVGLRIDTSVTERATPGIPWYDGFAPRASERWFWFALEVDRGTEPVRTLVGKAQVYRDLTSSGVYHKLFGGRPLLPVFLVPTERRAAQLVEAWRQAWPDGAGVASYPIAADHPEYGPLWGNYFHLANGTITKLLPWTLEQWEAARPQPTPPAPHHGPAAHPPHAAQRATPAAHGPAPQAGTSASRSAAPAAAAAVTPGAPQPDTRQAKPWQRRR